MELYIPHVIVQTQTGKVFPLNSFDCYNSLEEALNIIDKYISTNKTLFAYIEKHDGDKKSLIYYKCYMDNFGNVPYYDELENKVKKN